LAYLGTVRLFFFSLLLLIGPLAIATPDSLLYPTAQLNAFKSRVVAAKRYADTATVLFTSFEQAPSIHLQIEGAATLKIKEAFVAGEILPKVLALASNAKMPDTFLLLRRATQDTLSVHSRMAFAHVYSRNYQLKTSEYDITGFKSISLKESDGQWIYNATPKTKKSKEFLDAFYTFSNLQNKSLPLRYSRAIHYFHQLTGNGWPSWATFNKESASKPADPAIGSLHLYMRSVAPHPFYTADDIYISGDLTSEEQDSLSRVYKAWLQSRWKPIDSAYAQDPNFKVLIANATAAALRHQEPYTYVIELSARYGNAQTALQINNFRFAYPFMCGNDYGIRKLFLETARLAAQANEWPVFIWTHLFLSNTDKSGWERIVYDWDNRYAYTKELEYLGINLPELLLGMALTTDSKFTRKASSISSIWNESSEPKVIEDVFVAAASDTTLDLYNRMACYWSLTGQFQYSSYPASLKERTKILLKVAATLPHWAITQSKD
jgi:hypothetical protein